MQTKGAFEKIMFALVKRLLETGDVCKGELAPFLHLLCGIGLRLITDWRI